MKKELIIVNHIGTSVVDAINHELMALVEDVKKASKAETILAFSSQRAVNKLNKKGVKISHIHDVIMQAIGEYRTIKILPTHLVGGGDYKRVKEFVEDAALDQNLQDFNSEIILVDSLLTSEHNIIELVKVIVDLNKDKEESVLFVGHGTAHNSQSYYDRFLEIYKTINPKANLITLKDSPIEAIGEMTGKLHVFPLFTVSGHHIRMDVYEGKNSICNQLLKAGLDVSIDREGLLTYKKVRDLYVKAVMPD